MKKLFSLRFAASAALLLCAPGASTALWAADFTPKATVPVAANTLTSARQAIEAKDWAKAIGLLQQAVQSEPRNADAHNLLAYSLRKQVKPDLPGAFEHYKTALRLDPQHRGAHEYIGEAYLMDKQPLEAQKHLAALEKICGNKTCEEYEDLAKAIADYQAAQAKAPAAPNH